MLIKDLEADSIVTIEITSKGDKSARLESRIVKLTDTEFLKKVDGMAKKFKYSSYAFMQLCMKDNQVINFLSDTCRCAVTALYKDRPYRWENVKIARIDVPNSESVHIIFTNDDVDTFNRREEYRLWMGYDALVKLRGSKVPHAIILKDISWHGCGLIIDSRFECKVNDVVEVQFFEQNYSEEKKDYIAELYKMRGYIVRKVLLDDNKILLGCRSDNPNEVINKLVYKKQAERSRLGNSDKMQTLSELADKLKGLD